MNPMFEAHRTAYAQHTNPSADYQLGYKQIEVPTFEMWTNPRTGEQEIMYMRGWYIAFDHELDDVSNVHRIIVNLKSEGLSNQEIESRFTKFTSKREGIIGVHGAGVDRRELLRYEKVIKS